MGCINVKCLLSSWIYSVLQGAATFRNSSGNQNLWRLYCFSHIFILQRSISYRSIGSEVWPCHIILSMEIETPAPPALDKFRIIAFSFTLALEPELVKATCKQSHCHFSFFRGRKKLCFTGCWKTTRCYMRKWSTLPKRDLYEIHKVPFIAADYSSER